MRRSRVTPLARATGPVALREIELLFGEHADSLRAVNENTVPVQQTPHVREHLGKAREEVPDHPDRLGRGVVHQAAHAGVTIGESRSAEGLEDVVDRFPRIEGVEEVGERSRVQTGGSVAQEVIADAGQFGNDHPQVLAPPGHFDSQSFSTARCHATLLAMGEM